MSLPDKTADQREAKHAPTTNAQTADAIPIFRESFAILEANTPHLRKRVHQVRFDVFGREKRWEDDNGETYVERDGYDARARHALVVDRRHGMDIGAVRVVIPGADGPHDSAMPVQSHFEGGPFRSPDIVAICCEASRFCVVEDYRRRAGEADTSIGAVRGQAAPTGQQERRVLPFVPLALIQFIVRCALEEHRPVITALMEPFLIDMLAQLDIRFWPFAPAVSFRGTRHPCVMYDMTYMFERMRKNQPMVWQIVTDGGVLHDMALEIVPAVVGNAARQRIDESIALSRVAR